MTRKELINYLKSEYNTSPEYLWKNTPNCAVFRNKNNKWYGLLIDISKRKFGLDSDEIIDVLNIKADPFLIDVLIEKPGFYRAYHMNIVYQ